MWSFIIGGVGIALPVVVPPVREAMGYGAPTPKSPPPVSKVRLGAGRRRGAGACWVACGVQRRRGMLRCGLVCAGASSLRCAVLLTPARSPPAICCALQLIEAAKQ